MIEQRSRGVHFEQDGQPLLAEQAQFFADGRVQPEQTGLVLYEDNVARLGPSGDLLQGSHDGGGIGKFPGRCVGGCAGDLGFRCRGARVAIDMDGELFRTEGADLPTGPS